MEYPILRKKIAHIIMLPTFPSFEGQQTGSNLSLFYSPLHQKTAKLVELHCFEFLSN